MSEQLKDRQFDKAMIRGGVVWSYYWHPDKHLRHIGTPVVRNGEKLVAYKAGRHRIRYYHLTNCWHCGGAFLTSRWDADYCSAICRKANSRIGGR